MTRLLILFEPLILLLTAAAVLGCASPEASDRELLDTLDRELARSGHYVEERQRRIELLKEMRQGEGVSNEQLFELNFRLYDEYSSFQFDGAQSSLVENLSLAESMGNSERATDASIRLGMLYTTAGMYLEAQAVLTPLDTLAMSPSQKLEYEKTQQRFYREFREYSVHPDMVSEATRLQQYYRARLFETYGRESQEWLTLAVETAIGGGDMLRADSLNAILLAGHSPSSHLYAMYAYNQALIDYALERDDFRDWYVRSAIADIRSATKDNASLASLARQLFLDGENVDRAFKYVKASMDDAIFYNAKLRPWQIAQFMPVIEQAYLQRADVARRTQWILIGVLLLFAGYVAVMWRRTRNFATQIGAKNDRIEQINSDLHRKNAEQQRLTGEVIEANAVKEEYIGLLLAMCSDYIEKMLKMQRKISRRLADGDAKSLERELSASKLMDAEMKDFYNMFDSAFLRLYPDFIEEFNSLLQDDRQIVPPTGEMLDTELRIFALIRLGIDDSSKIATLLRYSPNTIYNYRAKVKNKAKGPREEFEDKIRTIGSFKSTL
jgi:hypothetical protein